MEFVKLVGYYVCTYILYLANILLFQRPDKKIATYIFFSLLHITSFSLSPLYFSLSFLYFALSFLYFALSFLYFALYFLYFSLSPLNISLAYYLRFFFSVQISIIFFFRLFIPLNNFLSSLSHRYTFLVFMFNLFFI